MPIKNYTTTIDATKTVAEIQKMLVARGARKIMLDYDPEGLLSAVCFSIVSPQGEIGFRLPANVDGVLRCLQQEAPRKLQTREQALRVGWRIVKDWVAAQMAIVEAELSNVFEVFMPYALTSDGRTLAEAVQSEPGRFLLEV